MVKSWRAKYLMDVSASHRQGDRHRQRAGARWGSGYLKVVLAVEMVRWGDAKPIATL